MAGLGAGTRSPASLTLMDAGNEPGGLRKCYGALLGAATWAALQAKWTTLIGAANAITLGALRSSTYGDKTTYAWSQPTNGAAREIKLLIQWADNTTGARGTSDLSTLDPTIPEYVVNINAKDVILLDSPSLIADFVTAFNDFNVNPATGNATHIVGLKVSRGGK